MRLAAVCALGVALGAARPARAGTPPLDAVSEVRESAIVSAELPSPAPDWQALPDVLAIQLQGSAGRLVSCAGRTPCAEAASTGFLADGRPDPRVTFTLEPIDGALTTGNRVALRTQGGKFVTVEGGASRVTATRNVRDVQETFTLEVVGGGAVRAGSTLTLRTHDGRYVTDPGDGGPLRADGQAPGPRESFTVRTLATFAALRGAASGRRVDVQALAEQFAPVVYHTNDESNFPTSVDRFLRRTELRGYDDCASPDWHHIYARAPSQAKLTAYTFTGGCGSSPSMPWNDGVVSSAGTRSQGKQRTFYLSDVEGPYRKGSLDSRDWTTYTHAYPNLQGGLTLQYWRFYAYNDALNDHGGDWEGIQVVLGADLRPDRLRYLGHTGIDTWAPADLEWDGDHPRVYSEGGGHASRPRGSDVAAKGANGHVDPGVPSTFVRQETWTDGEVQWFTGATSRSGGLLGLGSKGSPRNGQTFVQYSGLWGSPGALYATSGYWGPAFNETGMEDDHFVTAWCYGIQAAPEVMRAECYPGDVSR